MKKGKLIVISGPSGVGKGTVIDEILKSDKKFWKSISLTTRSIRDNEEEGINYYYVSLEEFLDNISKDNLLEYAEVYNGCYYGTPKNKVNSMLKKGYDVILEIDVEGALNVKKNFNDAILIFIDTPSIEELEKRLVGRGTETKEKIDERLNKAKWELSLKKKYDYVVINHNSKKTALQIIEFIDSKK